VVTILGDTSRAGRPDTSRRAEPTDPGRPIQRPLFAGAHASLPCVGDATLSPRSTTFIIRGQPHLPVDPCAVTSATDPLLASLDASCEHAARWMTSSALYYLLGIAPDHARGLAGSRPTPLFMIVLVFPQAGIVPHARLLLIILPSANAYQKILMFIHICTNCPSMPAPRLPCRCSHALLACCTRLVSRLTYNSISLYNAFACSEVLSMRSFHRRSFLMRYSTPPGSVSLRRVRIRARRPTSTANTTGRRCDAELRVFAHHGIAETVRSRGRPPPLCGGSARPRGLIAIDASPDARSHRETRACTPILCSSSSLARFASSNAGTEPLIRLARSTPRLPVAGSPPYRDDPRVCTGCTADHTADEARS
jgi:hypothetical protein